MALLPKSWTTEIYFLKFHYSHQINHYSKSSKKQKGVLWIDPNQQTVDLGKWIITVTTKDHNSICSKIDQLFNEITANIDNKLNCKNSCSKFPNPTCLQKKISITILRKILYKRLLHPMVIK